MELAEKKFKTFPWKLVGGSQLLWYVRYEAIREAESKLYRKKEREAEQAAKHRRATR